MICLPYKRTVGLELRTLNNMLHRQIIGSKNIRYVNELTGATSWIIGYLAHHQDKDVFQRDIEKEFSIRRSTASKCLSFMEQKGLIMRESVDYDARLKKLVLTERSIELHKLVENDIQEIEEKITEGLTDEEIDTFLTVISKIKNNLS